MKNGRAAGKLLLMNSAAEEYPGFDFIAPSFNAEKRICHYCKMPIEVTRLSYIGHSGFHFCNTGCLDEWQIQRKWWHFGRKMPLENIRQSYFFGMI